VPSILALGRQAAVRDCLASFARVATARGYSRPRLADGTGLRIVEGRHPVVEAYLPSGSFVPNGIELDAGEAAAEAGAAASPAESTGVDSARQHGGVQPAGSPVSFALITGPNMAGKSTFLRQTALIVLMAQAGSFVPALDVEIGIVDKIFCRVGAQDNLARGESTFLVEMHETAYILNMATRRSLVIMDEVGRGTSTLDGLSIAWAVSEHLLDSIRCRCLFATHYHELTAIEHARLRNYSLAVAEEEGEVVFLKRIEARPAEGSYGIHVAKLAGLPAAVLERARAMQLELARNERSLPAAARGALGADAPGQQSEAGRAPCAPAQAGLKQARPAELQAALFSPGDLVLAELGSIDIDRLSPLEALNRLSALKQKLQSG
jgi:DNA mismatch repair protein MutS